MFRRPALIPGGDTGPELAAVLAGTGLESTELALDELVEYGLLESRFTDRYRLHDLIRLFARARLNEEEATGELADSLDRVETYWVFSMATLAGRWFEPEFGSLLGDWDDQVPTENSAVAQHWIESDGANWLASLRTAAAGRRFGAVIDVAEAMDWFSDRWSERGHWAQVLRLARTAAEELGDAHTTIAGQRT